MKPVFSIFFLTLLPLCGFCETEIKGSPQELKNFLYPEDKIVSLHGHAEEKAYSDQAIVSLVITTEDDKLANALAANAALREKITVALVEAGIALDAIKSSKFSTSPEFGWFSSKPSSYKIVNRMAISIGEEKHLQDIAALSDQHDELELSDTTFEHSKKDEYQQKVKEKALDKILQQKSFYERSLGVKLTTIGIHDVQFRQQPTRGALVLEDSIASTKMARSKSMPSLAQEIAPTMPRSSFDELNYEANLSVDFRIEAKPKTE